MNRRSLGAVALALLIAAPAAAQQGPPPAVVVERIAVQPVNDPDEFTARVEAIESVQVRARVPGVLDRVAFEAGQMVAAGDLLFEIEPAQYEAALAAARAQLSRAEAARQDARRTLERMTTLLDRQTVAQAEFDRAEAAFDMASADVEAARAALRGAELDLSYTRIAAPIAGRIGRALHTRGNLVGVETGALARIVQLDPVRVVFSVPEGVVTTLRQQRGQDGQLDPQALRLTLRLPNDTVYGQTGHIEYVANEVDTQTGTIAVRLVFPNPDHLLVPNQFVTLIAQQEEAPRLPVVPQSAVLQDREGRFVYVLDDDHTVSRRRIETGARVGHGWAVTAGLDGGEPVIVQGIQRLSEGVRVQPTEGQPVGGGS